MIAHAWDDKPEVYMTTLKDVLEDFETELVVHETEKDFVREFRNAERCDFVITDLVNDKTGDPGSNEVDTGQRIASLAVKAGVPTFVVTSYADRMQLAQQMLPQEVIFKSKRVPPVWLAVEMMDDLKRLGFKDPDKVFFIYGRNAKINQSVESFLKNDLEIPHVEKLDEGKIVKSVKEGVLDMMSQASAIIAVCTPDVRTNDNTYLAAPNVMMEIGMALALPNASHRLIVLFQNSGRPETTVELPSDLGAELRIDFKESIEETFPALRQRLLHLRVSMNAINP